MDFASIKAKYDKGLWTKPMVRICVNKGLITASQYEEITGEVFA